MAIRHLFTIISEHLIVSDRRSLSAIDIIANVELDQIPGTLARLCILVGVTAEEGDDFSVTIEGPGPRPAKTEILKEGSIRNEGAKAIDIRRARNLVGYVVIQPIGFTAEGIHHVVVRQGRRIIHKYPFGVLKRPEPRENGDAGASN